jgi:predicted lysophospholipase L1 biosynthesis ABC-type transport system permease subunit
LKVVPSRVVLLLKTRSEPDREMIAGILAGLPVVPQAVRWEGTEREKVGKDMFVSLALENMKVFMIGGLIMSLAGVLVMGLANFISERRNFALLRLRGLPFTQILRFSLALFLVPVLVGIVFGAFLGAISGYGIAQAIWELPRVYGVAGFLENRLVISPMAYAIAAGFAVALSVVAVIFALWPLRKTAREAIKEA